MQQGEIKKTSIHRVVIMCACGHCPLVSLDVFHIEHVTSNNPFLCFFFFLMCCITSTALLRLSESCAKFVPTVPSLQVVLTVSELYILPSVLDK